jgi:hypothetical protein
MIISRVQFRFRHLIRSHTSRWFGTYHLQVFTGDVRGAGTTAKVVAKLFGERGETDDLFLDPTQSLTQSKRFGRATQCDFKLNADIGKVQRIQIGQDESEIGAGWWLDKVVVVDEDNHSVVFPCAAWLGVSDSGGVSGPPTVVLKPISKQEQFEDKEPTTILKLRVGTACFPHPDKVRAGVRAHNGVGCGYAGEDAISM